MADTAAAPSPAGAYGRATALFGRETPIRAWSLIVTIFGDCVSPRGGTLWLGSLQTIAGSLGIEAGLVRTALSRLAADGLVERTRVGRNSFVALSAAAEAETRRVAPQIYRFVERPWAGRWRFAVTGASARPEEAGLRDRLLRDGFGALAPGVLVAPLGEDDRLYSGRRPDYGGASLYDAVPAQGEGGGASGADRAGLGPAAAAGLWRLAELAEAHRRFLSDFEPVIADLETGDAPAPLEALAIRIVLVHAFRRMVLRDPLLPAELLPADWPGRDARALAGRLYGLVLEGSERWLDSEARRADGPLPPPDARLARRFP